MARPHSRTATFIADITERRPAAGGTVPGVPTGGVRERRPAPVVAANERLRTVAGGRRR